MAEKGRTISASGLTWGQIRPIDVDLILRTNVAELLQQELLQQETETISMEKANNLHLPHSNGRTLQDQKGKHIGISPEKNLLLSSRKAILEQFITVRNNIPTNIPPLILPCSIHSKKIGSTNVENVLSSLSKEGLIHKFKLSGMSQHILMLTADYIYLIKRSFKKDNEQELQLVNKFLKFVVESSKDALYISRNKLIDTLKIQDKEISTIFNKGFLVMRDATSFWFSIRNAGLFVKQLLQGSNDICKALKRRKNGNYTVSEILNRPWKGIHLQTSILIDYLVSCGKVEIFNSPSGPMISLIVSKSTPWRM